ncbi:MAG: chromosomal replication initiator protein DnaA [Deltaproteobacteria bacterium]|nr:chromosomal replication initiator protein DnaA [Deltaproteobacteria bacterium]
MLRSSDSQQEKNCEAAWSESLAVLRRDIDPNIFEAYLGKLEYQSFDEETREITIKSPSSFVSKQVDKNFKERIARLMCNLLGSNDISVKFLVSERSGSSLSGIPSPNASRSAHSPETSSAAPYVIVKKIAHTDKRIVEPPPFAFGQRPNPKYTFANFIVGNSNEFCHAAAMRVAEKPGESYNPLFIYGGVGLGKTHLLHAIGNSVLQARPSAKVLYLSSETFTNSLILSLRQAKMDEFKKLLRNIEVLLIDDIQFMRGKETTQEEFFHTFNALYSAKHQIVITSDKNPAEIPAIEERLRTRFAWGLIADLQAPDFETRVAILKEKAQRESFALPEEVAHFIAENFPSNVRELEGALTRLHAVSSLQKVDISIASATNALKPLLQPKVCNLSIDDVKKAVADYFKVKVSDLVSKRRSKNVAFPRHVAMYLCRKHTTCSYPEIGSYFGGRDHSSVIHAANVITNKVQTNPDVKSQVDEIEKRLFWN